LASLWEIQIKLGIGKLHLRLPLAQVVNEQQQINRIQLLPLKPPHIYALDQLPLHHKDPFDRMLIAQALHENMPLISIDPAFSAYPVQII
jgi:PIN domain nuclease of toxin-antitoxin system